MSARPPAAAWAALALSFATSFGWTTFLVVRSVANGTLTLPLLLLVLFVGAIFLIAAAVVILNRPHDPVNRALFPFLTLLGTLNACRIAGIPRVCEGSADRIAFAGCFVLWSLLMSWTVVTVWGFFPVRRLQRPEPWFALVTALGALPAAVYLRVWWQAGATAPPGGPWQQAVAVTALAVDLFVFVYFLSLAFLARREDVRRRARVVLVAVIVYIGIYILLRDIPTVGGDRPALPAWGISTLSVLFPLSLLVAVNRYRLFEVDRLIRRSTSYAVTSLVLVALLLTGAPLLATLVERWSPATRGPLTSAVVTTALFLVFDPLRRRAQRLLDLRIRRTQVDPGRLMAEIVAELKDAGDGLAGDVLHKLSQAFHPARQGFWIFTADASPSRPVTTGSLAALPDIDRTMLLAQTGGVEGGPTVLVLTADGGDPPFAKGGLADALREAGMVVAVPLYTASGEPLGLLALGKKRTGEPYLPEEQVVLDAVSAHLAVALERALLTKQVDEERRVREKVLGHLTESGGGTLYECEMCGRVATEDEVLCPRDGHAVQMTQAVPRMLADRYRLDQRLGQGGMGTVYAARDVPGKRDVAVKLIRAEQLRDKTALNRFRREARLTARLGHPNAVAVYDYGELPGGGAFLVMELLAGGSLRHELGLRSPVPVLESAWVLDHALDVLSVAHAAALVHRDIKPDNLFVTRGVSGGAVLKLLDFGLARETKHERALEARSSTSSVDVLVGTPGYIAPEVVAGEPASPASDLWAIAATGFELLSGVRLRIETADLPLKKLQEEVAQVLATAAPDVPPAYARALAAGLAVDPDDRPVSAYALRRALSRALGRRLPSDTEVVFASLDQPVAPWGAGPGFDEG